MHFELIVLNMSPMNTLKNTKKLKEF